MLADGYYLSWQSSEISTEKPIYTTFVKGDPEVAAVMPKLAAGYKMYADCDMLQQNNSNDFIPVDVSDKLAQCGTG